MPLAISAGAGVSLASISPDAETKVDAGIYSGSRHTALVPDTLDLADRAEMGIKGIGGTIDPDLHYMMYFSIHYHWRTPVMAHHSADPTCDPKYTESFPMLRLMCGTDRYRDIEDHQLADLVSRIDDGLYWNRYDPSRPWRLQHYNLNLKASDVPKNEDVSNVVGDARMLRALVTRRELERDTRWDRNIRDLVHGLDRIAIKRGDYSYYPDGGFGESFSYPRSGWQNIVEAQSEVEGTEGSVLAYHGHQIQGLARWYAMSGDPQALDLAARLTRYCMLPKFWGGLADPNHKQGSHAAGLPDPACISGNEQGHWYTHFHARAIGLRGMLEYARVADDWRVLEFVRKSYEYSQTVGIPRIGWINTYPGSDNLCEGCGLGDYAALAVRLSDGRMGDYWDDVDSLVRNHLVEQQLLRADLLERVAAASPPRDPSAISPSPGKEVTENVIARSLGNFAGQSAPTSVPRTWVMQCCTGNATQGLYYAWEGMVREEGDVSQVNLLLNRAARSLDVDSYLPYEGRVVIRNKRARKVLVRIPSWVPVRSLRATVADQPRPAIWAGNYLSFDSLRPGDAIKLEFDNPRMTASYTANSQTKVETTYKCEFRGSTLVDISPRDGAPTSYPLYLRDHLKQDKAPIKERTRFVAERKIVKW
jgi:hypothetical protein